HFTQGVGVKFAELLPFRQEEYRICIMCSRHSVISEFQGRPRTGSVLVCLRIGHDDVCALELQLCRHIQCGRISHVVRVGFECCPEYRDSLTDDGTATDLAGEIDHSDTPAHIDRIHLCKEAECLVSAELASARHERSDILWQA